MGKRVDKVRIMWNGPFIRKLDPSSSLLEPSVIYAAYGIHYSDNHDIQVTASISRKLTFSRSQVRGSKSKIEDINFFRNMLKLPF